MRSQDGNKVLRTDTAVTFPLALAALVPRRKSSQRAPRPGAISACWGEPSRVRASGDEGPGLRYGSGSGSGYVRGCYPWIHHR